jgi:hypothetical protein
MLLRIISKSVTVILDFLLMFVEPQEIPESCDVIDS